LVDTKQKATIDDLENELPSKIFSYLCIEPQSIKQLAIKIYGQDKENVRKGITDWLKRFSESEWIEQKSKFTKEKFYAIKNNPFHEWIASLNLTKQESEYLHFLIEKFLIERVKRVGVHRNIIHSATRLISDASAIKSTHTRFGFGKKYDSIVKMADKVQKSGKYLIPDKIVKTNEEAYKNIKVGQGWYDLTFIFAALLMPENLPYKLEVFI